MAEIRASIAAMGNIDRPNLFAFATSELSQDAWLCWLLAHVGRDDVPELRDAAHDFVARIWNGAFPGEAADAAAISGPVTVLRQWKHTDILVHLRVRNRDAVLLIEDKTETTQHSDQLERYRDTVARKYPTAVLVPIYFKTGYHFESDTAARSAGYQVVSLEDLVEVLETHAPKVRSDVFHEYARFQRAQLADRRKVLAGIEAPGGHRLFEHDFAQHAFLVNLREVAASGDDLRILKTHANLDGKPWSHWRFAVAKESLPGGVRETLFHRIDARKDDAGKRRYYLSTRQYAAVKKLEKNEEARRVKVARLREYRAMFEHACVGSVLSFAKPSADHRGANESEIGILFFDDAENSTVNVLHHFARVHRAFIGRFGVDHGGS